MMRAMTRPQKLTNSAGQFDGETSILCVKNVSVHRNMALDTRYFLARVIALQGRCVRVLHSLRIHDQERA